MDRLSKEHRSWLMGRVGSKDTAPELVVRSLLHRMGYRFRLHAPDLPGKPDIVLPRHGRVVFVHGCFWHRHRGCRLATTPKTRKRFWEDKFRRNVERDLRNVRRLRRAGWGVATVWECETKDPEKLERRLARFLDG